MNTVIFVLTVTLNLGGDLHEFEVDSYYSMEDCEERMNTLKQEGFTQLVCEEVR